MSWLLFLYYTSFLACSAYAGHSLKKYGIFYTNVYGVYLIAVTLVELLLLIGEATTSITNDALTLAYKLVFLFTSSFIVVLYTLGFRRRYRYIVMLFAMAAIITLSVYGDLFTGSFSTTFGVINSVLVISICLIWYIHKVSLVDETMIYTDPFFWYTTGLFLWASVFLLRILPAQFLRFRDGQFLSLLHALNLGVNIISNALFIMGLKMANKQMCNYDN